MSEDGIQVLRFRDLGFMVQEVSGLRDSEFRFWGLVSGWMIDFPMNTPS